MTPVSKYTAAPVGSWYDVPTRCSNSPRMKARGDPKNRLRPLRNIVDVQRQLRLQPDSSQPQPRPDIRALLSLRLLAGRVCGNGREIAQVQVHVIVDASGTRPVGTRAQRRQEI